MTNSDWLISIENAAATVAKEIGWNTVLFVLQEYGGASSIEDLNPGSYRAVYNAIFDYEVGMKD